MMSHHLGTLQRLGFPSPAPAPAQGLWDLPAGEGSGNLPVLGRWAPDGSDCSSFCLVIPSPRLCD